MTAKYRDIAITLGLTLIPVPLFVLTVEESQVGPCGPARAWVALVGSAGCAAMELLAVRRVVKSFQNRVSLKGLVLSALPGALFLFALIWVFVGFASLPRS